MLNVEALFENYGIPAQPQDGSIAYKAKRVLMVSTHGYWGDPPPAGVPDTGGQTFYVLQVSKAWARQGKQVLILVRRFDNEPPVEKIAHNVWLIRMDAGSQEFVRKEDIYPLTPQLAESAVAIGKHFGANSVVGHYADGMAVAAEVAAQLQIPLVVIPHSLGVLKMKNMGYNPKKRKHLRDPKYNFWMRESFELTALQACDLEIPNTPLEPAALKEHYHFETRHEVMPAGASQHFFDEAKQPANQKILEHFGLKEKKYIIVWGRFSEAKNFPGAVKAFGEFRRIAAGKHKDVKLLISGGAGKDASEEELRVLHAIEERCAKYDLSSNDVVRIESVTPKEIACLARASLAYLGMQFLEPFGMAPAEAMAAGAPVMISNRAGIVDWLEDGKNAIFVDPEQPEKVGQQIMDLLEDSQKQKALSEAGYKKAQESFSWDGIAKKQGEWLDRLLEEPNRRRGYHRITAAWRGDIPTIRPEHERVADQLYEPIAAKIRECKKAGRRAIFVIGGESGSGKTEIAHLMTLNLRKEITRALIIPGDAFFKLVPFDNHAQRFRADQEGRLEEAIGPQEVDLDKLDAILKEAGDLSTRGVIVPSESRTLPGRRYERVPVGLEMIDAIFVDLTYGLLLKNVDYRIFLEASSLKQIDVVRARNLKRDPDQDFTFVERVLQCEHKIIAPLKEKADLVVDEDYHVVKRQI